MCVVPEPYGGDVTVYSSTQIPHILKIQLAVVLGIAEHRIRVVAPAVGGGFGSKLNVYAEEALALAVALRLQRPVRWVEERTEATLATTHGRGMIQRIELAADSRRSYHRGPGPTPRRHGRVPAARDAGHPVARRVRVPRRL